MAYEMQALAIEPRGSKNDAMISAIQFSMSMYNEKAKKLST